MARTDRILFTGGHLTPALAVLDDLQQKGYKNFIWVGHKYTMLGDKEPGLEYKVITQKGIPFFHLTTGKLYRYLSLKGIRSFFQIPIGFWQALGIIRKTKPRIVVSFGGYLAVPVVVAAALHKIPIVTHEQTSVVGLANRIISHFAKQIYITWPTSAQYFPKEKTILTGNPIRQSIFTSKKELFNFGNSLPIIYITGGNQGSHAINMVIADGLEVLLEKYNLIHQCGSNSIFNDFQTLEEKKEKLPKHLQERYRIEKSIGENEIGTAFNKATIVISRGGGNTIYELIALKKPCIIVPLPVSSHNEQYKNGKIVESIGLGNIIEQRYLTVNTLLQTIHAFDEKYTQWRNEGDTVWQEICQKADQIIIPDAQVRIASEIEKLLVTP